MIARSALGWVARTTRKSGSSIGARFGCRVPPSLASRARTRAGAIRGGWADGGAAADCVGLATGRLAGARGGWCGTMPGTAEVIAGSSPTLYPSADRPPVYGERANRAETACGQHADGSSVQLFARHTTRSTLSTSDSDERGQLF